MCSVGEMQLLADFGNTEIRITQHIRGSLHREFHTVLEKALSGVSAHNFSKI